jgi:hypothetical protein
MYQGGTLVDARGALGLCQKFLVDIDSGAHSRSLEEDASSIHQLMPVMMPARAPLGESSIASSREDISGDVVQIINADSVLRQGMSTTRRP